MNKTAKIISLALTFLIAFSVSISALMTTVASNSIIFSIEKVSENDSEVVISLNLEEGKVANYDLQLTAK